MFISLNLHAVEVSHEFIPFLNKEKVEIFRATPPGKGPFPVYIFAQPFRSKTLPPESKTGILENLARYGFVAVLFSYAPDNCGKLSQEGLKAIIRHIKTLPTVDPAKIVLHGSSMGASLAALVASDVPDIGALILENGVYDIEKMMLRLSHQSFHDPDVRRFYEELNVATGNDPDRFRIRSHLNEGIRIKAPVLILTGGADNLALSWDAFRFHELLLKSGTDTRLKLYPFIGHEIEPKVKNPDLIKFIRKHITKKKAP